MVWFKTQCIDLSLYVGDDTIRPVSVVRHLGVLLDQELTTKQHISNVGGGYDTDIVFYHTGRLKKVLRSILGPKITANLVSAFVLNRLDYCILCIYVNTHTSPLFLNLFTG